MKTTTNQPRKRIVIAAVIIGAAVLLAAGTYAYGALTGSFLSTPESAAPESSDNSVNYEPPTDQEIRDSQNGKKNHNEDQKAPEKDPITNLQKVEVGIAFADIIDTALEVRAFTPSVVEGTGTCTATLKQGGLVLERTTQAFIDSATSQCKPIQIPLSAFPKTGTWLLTVTYKSSTSQGKSEIIEVGIP